MPATARSGWRQHMQRIWLGRGPLAWLLRPIAGLYGLLVRLRRWLYAAGLLRTEQAGVPVIVVGNVIAGGAGKTPVVMALVRHLQSRGFQPGVVSRGYGRNTQDCREVQSTDAPQQVGDEPLLIRQRTAAPVFVAQRRIDAARDLLTRYPDTQIIVCDDGLQHLALARDLEICVFDNRGTGNGWLLPAGPLREPWPRPVDLVLHTGSRPAFAGHTAQRALSRMCRRADGQTAELAGLAQSPSPLLAVAGIANPQSFFDMLRTAGLSVAATQALPDHHDYADWQAPAGGPYTVLCTEKDAAKLWPRCPQAWAVALELTPEPDFFADIDRRLARMTTAPLSSPHGHTTT